MVSVVVVGKMVVVVRLGISRALARGLGRRRCQVRGEVRGVVVVFAVARGVVDDVSAL
jgi:hypothetical protein